MDYLLNARPTTIFRVALIGRWIINLWEVYIHIRQIKAIDASPVPPLGYRDVFFIWEYQIQRMYMRDLMMYGVIYHSSMLVIVTVFLLMNGFYLEWITAGKILESLRCHPSTEIPQTIIFCIVHATVEAFIYIPFSILDHYMNDFYFGPHDDNFITFATSLALRIFFKSLGEILFALLFIIPILRRGQNGLVIMWAAFFIFHVFLACIEIFFITKMTHTIYPLPAGHLKTSVDKLINRMELPSMEVKVMEVSHETSQANAYAFEFLTFKEIVIFDTLINSPWGGPNKVTEDEVLAVIAHELAHLKCQHVYQTEIMEMLLFAADICLFVVTYNNPKVYMAFSFFGENPIVIGLKLASVTFYPIHKLLKVYERYILRRHEYEADAMSKKYGYGASMRSILRKLMKTNMAFPVYDKLYSFWYLGHPPVIDRIEVLKD